MQADEGPRQPTKTNDGQQQRTQANAGQQRLAKQQQGRGARDAKPSRALGFLCSVK